MKSCKFLLLSSVLTTVTLKTSARHTGSLNAKENCIAENYVSVDSHLLYFYVCPFKACKIEDAEMTLLAEFNNTNRIGCFDRCSLNPLCQHWTWWGDTEHCQLFNKCQPNLQDRCKDCLTGPR